jgi:hypothetical protein
MVRRQRRVPLENIEGTGGAVSRFKAWDGGMDVDGDIGLLVADDGGDVGEGGGGGGDDGLVFFGRDEAGEGRQQGGHR